MNVWTKGDDAAVCLSYCDHGAKATPELLAALSHLPPGSIRMRLHNVEYLATGGTRGLSGVAAQTREVWTPGHRKVKPWYHVTPRSQPLMRQG